MATTKKATTTASGSESARKLPNGKHYCTMCDTLQTDKNFYESTSIINKNCLLHVCKDCCNELFNYHYKKHKSLDNNFDVNGDTILFTVTTEMAIRDTCEFLDIPFLYSAYDSMVSHINSFKLKKTNVTSIFGIYKSKLSSTCKKNGTSGMCFKDSDKLKIEKDQAVHNRINNEIDFVLTDEIKNKWGLGYKPEEYEAFEKKYYFLKNNYSEVTAMHTEALLNYIRYKVKEEFAVAGDNVTEAEKWNKMANQASQYAKINPNQLSKADLSDGLTTFSELSMAIEREVDIIKVLPKFKYRPNDALDFNIWCYVNYVRDLKGMQPAEYYDVYRFYDERVQDYVRQYGDPYGIFKDDCTVANREKILQFLEDEKRQMGIEE